MTYYTAPCLKHLPPVIDHSDLEKIEKEVCKRFRLSPADLRTRSRKTLYVQPRQVFFYLADLYTDHSQQTIGEWLGYDRTSVITSRDVIKGYIKIYIHWANTINVLRILCSL